MGWIIDVMAGALKGAGRQDLAEWLSNAPAKIGEEIGKIIVADQKDGGMLTQTAIDRLDELKRENPIDSGSISCCLEDEYAADMESFRLRVLSQEGSAKKRIVAVRGFFHDKNCIAVWSIDGKAEPKIKALPSVFSSGEKNVQFHDSARIYLMPPNPSDEHLSHLNIKIEHDPTGFESEIKNSFIAAVKAVTKNNVVTVERAVDRARRGARADVEIEHAINGREGIAEAFRTLELALNSQAKRLREYRDARDRS